MTVTYVQQQTETIYWKICGTSVVQSLEIWMNLSHYSTKICPQDIRDPKTPLLTHSLPINDLENSQTYRKNMGGGEKMCVSFFSTQFVSLCSTITE